MPQHIPHEDKEFLKSFLDKYDVFIFDCDGVLWINDDLIGRAKEALDHLRKLGKTVVFCTNNATLSRQMYKEKFERLGVFCHEDELFTSAHASAYFLKHMLLPQLEPSNRGIFLIGQKGLEDEMVAVGLEWEGGTDEKYSSHLPYQDFSSIEPKPHIGVVLVGFDMHMNYNKLAHAYAILSHKEENAKGRAAKLVLFVYIFEGRMIPHVKWNSTNADSNVPLANGLNAPGEGALAAPLLHARPDLPEATLIVGKPNQIFFDSIHHKLSFDKSRALMVGDRLDTDIKFGRNGGVDTLWVLSGAGKIKDLENTLECDHPHFIAPGISIFAL
ncbi:2-phosphoglycolate phosphatase [Atractiella rhizophila]|nr:2-phosphoglycolate phosphatase [Atractiella rhizophila]